MKKGYQLFVLLLVACQINLAFAIAIPTNPIVLPTNPIVLPTIAIVLPGNPIVLPDDLSVAPKARFLGATPTTPKIHNLGDRFYSNVLGRFLTTDRKMATNSAYAYTDGNPIRTSDPTGNSIWSTIFAVIGVVVGVVVVAATLGAAAPEVTALDTAVVSTDISGAGAVETTNAAAGAVEDGVIGSSDVTYTEGGEIAQKLESNGQEVLRLRGGGPGSSKPASGFHDITEMQDRAIAAPGHSGLAVDRAPSAAINRALEIQSSETEAQQEGESVYTSLADHVRHSAFTDAEPRSGVMSAFDDDWEPGLDNWVRFDRNAIDTPDPSVTSRAPQPGINGDTSADGWAANDGNGIDETGGGNGGTNGTGYSSRGPSFLNHLDSHGDEEFGDFVSGFDNELLTNPVRPSTFEYITSVTSRAKIAIGMGVGFAAVVGSGLGVYFGTKNHHHSPSPSPTPTPTPTPTP